MVVSQRLGAGDWVPATGCQQLGASGCEPVVGCSSNDVSNNGIAQMLTQAAPTLLSGAGGWRLDGAIDRCDQQNLANCVGYIDQSS